ncbi:1,4-alpha-glucan-branching enzyme [Candidatus Moduliflexus flocculans]|uniref:1,4-alpha-glucan branching enzyme GlgB n=1 Tax=Candidatus Moduliflexus flocculans TaxID=1499966 RepID=A0A0S6W011_9BACT|nr:1,4-alpha-glucan-branching enzyme [Candidatus Moduliflexus flocculans]
MKTVLVQKKIHALLNLTCSDPFEILGMRSLPTEGKRGSLTVRALLPGMDNASIYDPHRQKRYPMTRIHEAGLFEKTFANRKKPFPYEIEVLNGHGEPHRFFDPYAFPSLLSADALSAFLSDAAYDIYESLGCHFREVDGVNGALFAVWAPNAKGVSVIGDFNNWNGLRHPMRLLKKWGVWELFLPDVKEGDRYQYQIVTAQGEKIQKSDPYGFAFELPPSNKTIVTALHDFPWEDANWLEQRKQYTPLKSPISTYEVHLGSWMKHAGEDNRFLTYRELAETLIPYIKELGFTHIELMPVAEHPFYGSWGYQVTGYYAPSSRYGTPADFMFFVNECHRAGIGVLMDWVPAHFPRDSFALGEFDGGNLYEHADPNMAEHKDWGTLIFDYGRNEVKNFLIANALFWLNTYHIDGIRVDAVASMLYLDYSRKEGEWTPNKYGGRENLDAVEFLKELNLVIHHDFPGVMTLAEESTSWLGVTYPTYIGGLNFTFKWNLGWMNDMLHYLSHDPIYRKFVHTMVPFALLYAFHEHFVLELSHDEVVHGKGSLLNKMPGDDVSKFANLRLLYGFMFGHPGKKLLFMGGEFGQWREWDHDSNLEWHLLQYAPHQGLQRFVRDLNHLYLSEPALYLDDIEERCFEWIDYHDFERSIFSFMRKAYNHGQHTVICIYNFTPVARYEYRLGVPSAGYYQEILNSDAAEYDGNGLRNHFCHAEPIPWHQQPYSVTLTLPPLSAIMLKPVGDRLPEAPIIEAKAETPIPAIEATAEMPQSMLTDVKITSSEKLSEHTPRAEQPQEKAESINNDIASIQTSVFPTLRQAILPQVAYLPFLTAHQEETPIGLEREETLSGVPESRSAHSQGSKEQHLPPIKKTKSKRSSG